MAIEFECPNCAAVMRVPDAYAGKQGRCPQCETRLLVPNIPRPDASNAPPAEVGPTHTTVPQATPVPTPAATAVPTERNPVPRTSRRIRSRRRPARALVIGIPVIGFLLLLGIIAVSLTGKLPELNGNLAARMLTEKSLPRIIIPWSDTGLSQADRQTLQTILAENAETLTSELVTCRLIGTDDGIAVQWTASATAAWCVVDAVSDSEKPLSLWLKKERPRLNAARRTELLDALTSYCRDKLQQAAGADIKLDATRTRDSVALNAATDALGFAVVAKAAERVIRPAVENEQGQLYFCVPDETAAFILSGRGSSSGLLFPGSYDVIIAPATETPPLPETGTEPELGNDSDMLNPSGAQSVPDARPEDTLKMQQ